MRRIQVNPNADDTRIRDYSQTVDTQKLYRVDFSKVATEQSTSVSSVAWESVGYRKMSFASESLSSNVADAYLSADWCGKATVKVTATLANGRTNVVYFNVDIDDPEYRTYSR